MRAKPEELVCAALATVIPLDRERFWVQALGSRQSTLVDRMQAQFLSVCRQFRPLSDHLAVFRASHPKARADLLAQAVPELIQKGLLCTGSGLLDQLREGEGEGAPEAAPIRYFSVPTRNRTEGLARCLKGFAANARAHGHAPEILIADDSDTAEARSQVRAAACDAVRETGLQGVYLGPEERERLADELIREGDLPPEVVRYALFDPDRYGFTASNNRNAMLLATVGESLASVDDDTEARFSRPPGYRGDIEITAEGDPSSFFVYPDEESLFAEVDWHDVDFFGEHAAFLGRTVGQCLARSRGDAIELRGASSMTVADARLGVPRVRATWMGLLRDPGMANPSPLLWFRGDAFARLTKDEKTYRAACVNRRMNRVTTRPVLTRGFSFQTLAWAVDNRDLLPPFVPGSRGTDYTWGFIYRQLFQEAWIAYLPYAVLHSPLSNRLWDADSIWQSAGHINHYNVFGMFMNDYRPHPLSKDGETRMRDMGRHLMSLAAIRAESFEELYRLRVAEFASQQIQALEPRLSSPDAAGAPFWADDVRRWLDTFRKTLESGDVFRPDEADAKATPQEAIARIQRFVYRSGELLRFWPDIVSAARELKERGFRCVRPWEN